VALDRGHDLFRVDRGSPALQPFGQFFRQRRGVIGGAHKADAMLAQKLKKFCQAGQGSLPRHNTPSMSVIK